MITEKHHLINALRDRFIIAKSDPVSMSKEALPIGLGKIEKCFPGGVFPRGTIHEFIAQAPEDAAASEGFIAAILSRLMENANSCVWVSRNRKLFPPALTAFGAPAQQIIFVDLNYTKEILWVTEEALKCDGLSCVIAEISDLDFAQSRRLQLATEKSKVTGIILRKQAKRVLSASACAARWQIFPYPSETIPGMPGVGYPRWEVNLIKVKNGEGGKFHIEWAEDRFSPFLIEKAEPYLPTQQTG